MLLSMKTLKRVSSSSQLSLLAGVARDSETLCLTPFRSFQKDRLNGSKEYLKGRFFAMRSRPSTFCRQNKSMLLHYENGKISHATFLRIPCRSWTCPDCAPIKTHRVTALLKDIIIRNDMKYFLTLTLDPANIPSEYLVPENQTHKYITKLFNSLLSNIRLIEKDLRYVWVIEFQRNGNAHMHIVLNTRLDIVQVRKIWTRIGGGPQSRVMQIRDLVSIAAYLAKYVGKSLLGSIGNLHYFERRYSISHYCIRPIIPKAQPFYPELSHVGHCAILSQVGLLWVYNKL